MFFFDEIWHVVIRIAGALVLNPPGLPAWATWFLLIIRTIVVVVIFRRNIGPFMLVKVSGRIRARSISPRSIKGLYFRSHGRTWRVERIGWAFHPWAESRLSVKIEGLHVDVAEPKMRMQRRRSTFRRFPTQNKMASFATIREAVSFLSERIPTFTWIYKKVLSGSITLARLLVRCLPSLTQNLDFELDSVVVSFAALSGAHIMIGGVMLSTKVEFSHLEREVETFNRDAKRIESEANREKYSPWYMFSGTDRFWDLLWGQTRAFASVDITLDKLAIYTPSSPSVPPRLSSFSADDPSPPFLTYSAMNRRLPAGAVVNVATPLRFVASLQFIPKQLTVQHQSVYCSLEVPRVDISANGVRLLMDLNNSKKKKFDTVELSPLGTSNEPWAPPPTSTEIASLPGPGSPTSPLLAAFSHITRHVRSEPVSSSAPPVQRIKDLTEQSFLSLFKSIRFRLSAISITYDLPASQESSDSAKYVACLDDLRLDLTPSDPRMDALHREWVGSSVFSALDGTAINASCHFDLATLKRFPSSSVKKPTCLLALRGLTLDVLATNWPQPWIPTAPLFSGNPNDSFVACEISISKVDLFERLEDLCGVVLTTQSPTSLHRLPIALKCIPRIELRAVCGDISAYVAYVDKGGADTSTLSVQTAGFNVELSTSYHTIPNLVLQGVDHAPHKESVQMNSRCCVSIKPILARILQTEAGWERIPSISPSEPGTHDDEFLLGLETLELVMTGHTLGQFEYAESFILPYTTTTDIQCTTEAVSVELWKLECVKLWSTFLDAFRTRDPPAKYASDHSNVRCLFPGVSFHFSVGCFAGIINAKDINPNCDLDLSRGLEVRTGCSLQYSCMQGSRDSWHVKIRVSNAQGRQKLGLPEDHLVRLMPVANAVTASDDTLANFQGGTWHTTCRSATSTPYAADFNCDIEREVISKEQLQEGLFISVPQTLINVSLRRRKLNASTPDSEAEETCNISAELPYFMGRLDLLNLYSSLLALHTLQSLVPRTRRYPSQSAPRLVTTVRMRMENIHISCVFPLHERIFVRALSLSLEWRPGGTTKAKCESVVAWVPSMQSSDQWEELSRIRDLTVGLNRSPHVIVSVVADGFRTVIPHRYVLSELILNILLATKAIRHLHRAVNSGHYTKMEAPAAETPKKLPEINVRIHSLCLEAADNSFEAKLGLIWRTGFQAQKVRVERELAFEAKLRAILASGDPTASYDASSQSGLHYHFTTKRTTSVVDARNRLNLIHSNSWLSAISRQKANIARKEESILRQLRYATRKKDFYMPVPIRIFNPGSVPPLFRAVVNDLVLSASSPNLPGGYEGFLFELGKMPRSTEYSLLLPVRLHLNLKATRISLRDYRLPLLDVPFRADGPSVEFETNLVIAEEMGNADSVEWFQVPVYRENTGIVGAKAFEIEVPKTIMPVKSYASPVIHFRNPEVVRFTWGVSYNPSIQEVMHVIETLSHPPRDPSPAIGFWDKLRLVFHWRIETSFEGGARLHFKGSRDPYQLTGVGAGFDFCWDGHVAIKVGYPNEENELIQLTSDSMTITIPNYKDMWDVTAVENLSELYSEPVTDKESPPSLWRPRNDKVCAKFANGIRWGVGIVLERTCGLECKTCHGHDFIDGCRFFTFIPHYQVVLHTVDSEPNFRDSYAGFRSNFIHFSTSLTSPLSLQRQNKHNSFHLTPRTFAHFWSWWHLFDSALSLPIRQGRLFPDSHPPSKKFGRHLATLKYRISFASLYITHVYRIDDGDAWSAGESRCVGVKAFIEHFQADMHQREEETPKSTGNENESKMIRHKPFSAVEVVIKGLDLRALFAVFSEPQKKSISLKDSLPGTTNFWEKLLPTPLSSSWVDADDFVELDWSPSDLEPNLFLLQAASCPRFVYHRRTPETCPPEDQNNASQMKHMTKFGDENTHFCLMGKEPTVQEVQLELGAARLAELRAHLADSVRKNCAGTAELYHEYEPNSPARDANDAARRISLTQMITLLERYVTHLSQLRSAAPETGERVPSSTQDLYDMPTSVMLPFVGEFINVYDVHCPKISLTNATRNILQHYYLASRARRGFEYHMSMRAVKFIRDQARPTQALIREIVGPEKRQRYTAEAAAQAFRRILTGEERHQPDNTRRTERQRSYSLSSNDPLFGWDEGVSETKAHLCLLLKPQIVLRSENNARSALVLAANHVVLRNHGILDTCNAEDPVSGYVMQRNYADINSLQMFQPIIGSCADHLPLEVFVDLRCESRDFDRLMPQTHAILRYDKFNRLRLRNNVTTVAISSPDGDMDMVDHLLHETDLIVVEVPRFSVSADASAFTSMNDVVTNLLLFQDPVHKARMTQLETMLFSYDFNDLVSAARVVADLQSQIRQLLRVEEEFALDSAELDDASQHDLLANRAHVLTLSQELNLIFDAIKLAQDKADERNQEKKSALRLQASSSEISWHMVGENRELLAKLAVRGIDYSWLSQRDSSSTSRMDIRDLQVFDGSPYASLPEILAKHHDPPNHYMIRRGLFAEIQWGVLAPVGGISIYDRFEVELHPIRLALETQLGNRILDYLLPSRRSRREAAQPETVSASDILSENRLVDNGAFSAHQLAPPSKSGLPGISVPRPHKNQEARLVSSRSFSNLRSAAADPHAMEYYAPGIPKSRSSTALADRRQSLESSSRRHTQSRQSSSGKPEGDALEMTQRSAQKTFVHVKIPSVHVLLSVMKGRNVLVRDARLRTHDLEWRNRTWSLDELLSQFIPSDPSWRGWVKVAWQQHVFSVGGVVKELITKTQWGRMGKNPEEEDGHPSRIPASRLVNDSPDQHLPLMPLEPPDTLASHTDSDTGMVSNHGSGLVPHRHSASKMRMSSFVGRARSRKTRSESTESLQSNIYENFPILRTQDDT